MKKLIIVLFMIIVTSFSMAQSVRIAPDSAASFFQAYVNFSWHTLNVSTDTLYHLQVATTSGFSVLLVNDSTKVGGSDTTRLWKGFYGSGATYYWRIRTKTKGVTHPATWSSYSTTWNVTLDTTITGRSPDSASVLWTRSVTLEWDIASTNDTLYDVHVSTNSSYSNSVFRDSTLTTPSKTLTSFYTDTLYYWRVRAKVKGSIVASGTWSTYTTGWSCIITKYPDLTTPINTSTGIILPRVFRWEAITSPADTIYHLQIASSSAFSTLYVNDSTLVTAYKSVTWLPSGATLYWRVRSKMKGDTLPGIWSPYSSAWHITLYNMENQTLKAPANKSSYWPSPVTFTWRAHASDSIWETQVATSKTFSSITLAIDTTVSDSTFAGTLSTATNYYWRVRPWITGRSWASYSPVWTFRTANDTPAVLTLNFPHDLFSSTDTALTFTWTAGSRDSLYRIQVATDTAFSSIAKQDSCLVPFKQITGLTGSTTYYWRVKAISKKAEGQYCIRQRFTTRSTKHK